MNGRNDDEMVSRMLPARVRCVSVMNLLPFEVLRPLPYASYTAAGDASYPVPSSLKVNSGRRKGKVEDLEYLLSDSHVDYD